ncbi:MAG: glycosyltransferase family 39 protein [Merismopedia sp. SIO2A8]|nr:glycosyltransferase family 39 protein [Merismopedia sp. SIO2A8]
MAQFSSQPPRSFKVVRWPYIWLSLIDRWSEWLVGLGLLGASLLLFTIHLGGVPLRDWDEGLVAQVAKEMALTPFAQQTWLHPTLHGQPYFNKPPLVHWLVAIAYSLGGIHEWTARLPGAWATALSVPLLYRLGRELFPQRLVAILSACTYLTLLPVVRHGRLAMLDGMILCGFIALLICTLRVRRSPQWSVGMGLCFSLLCLTKGTLGLPLLAIALGFLAWDAPRLFRSLHWWAGLLIGCIPALLWYAVQGIHYGALFWDAHIVEQVFNRAVDVVEQNSGPPWYYLLELLKYSWPWLIFLPMGTRAVYRDRALSWAKLVTIWGVGYLGLISMMGTKLPWYIMPLYPVVALVIGVELHRLWKTLSGASPALAPSKTYQRTIFGFLAQNRYGEKQLQKFISLYA